MLIDGTWLSANASDNTVVVPAHKFFEKASKDRGSCVVSVWQSTPPTLRQEPVLNTIQNAIGLRAVWKQGLSLWMRLPSPAFCQNEFLVMTKLIDTSCGLSGPKLIAEDFSARAHVGSCFLLQITCFLSLKVLIKAVGLKTKLLRLETLALIFLLGLAHLQSPTGDALPRCSLLPISFSSTMPP